MGKSAPSCFKIIACGSDSVDHDDLQTPESKVSSSRSGWSFRKRSPKHRVLSNTVISEASSVDKERQESSAPNIHEQPNLTVPEKTSVIQWTEQKDTIASKEEDNSADATIDESSIILIQAAIRGHLARRVLLKERNAIKLQAAVRGHLVRCKAVGTLRCVQAIVKMQALIRARLANRIVEGSGDFEKQKNNSAKDSHSPTDLRIKREIKLNVTYTYTSIEKLLSNKFARQLMESTPRTKAINIKCDPSKDDSAWKWLERWMAASPSSNEVSNESSLKHHDKENIGYYGGEGDILVPSDLRSESKDLKSAPVTSAETSENVEFSLTYDADNLDIHSCSSISPSTSHSHLQNMEESNSRDDVTVSGAIQVNEPDLISEVDTKSVPFEDATENGQDIPDVGKFSIEQPDTEGEGFSSKANNPSFIAAESELEEPSPTAASEILTTLSGYYPVAESSSDKISASTDPPFSSKEIVLNENSISNASAVQIAISECGTELSISSTLDSPDMSEGVNDLEQVPKILDVNDHSKSRELELEAIPNSSILGTESSYNNINQECVDSTIVSDSSPLEKKSEADEISDLQVELGSEASPRSHMAIPESQATPSSQVSLNPEKSIGKKSDSIRKKKSLSADKKFIPNPNQDSATESSPDQSRKEYKIGKRRDSFGSAKIDHEPRDSSGSNSLPSYMQATESAKAKAISNGSPRSSSDVQDKDIIIKNRLSLPGTNGRQGSPRINRSPSQAHQNANGNGVHSPQDRKWRR
ncbi:hypothetical protein ACS0TY_036542 [Phlomoides rotata]